MFYLSKESLIESTKRLHDSGAHESFRNYLVLKAHGLKFGHDSYLSITTTNTTPALQLLFGVPGLPEDEPFYNPLRNERLKHDAARGIIQTNVKKYLDEATKTKMKWLEGHQSREQDWLIRFSAEYPNSLGRGEAGLADKDGVQLTVHTPSFVIWMNRNSEWESRPNFTSLWMTVRESLNLHPVEVDLLFTKDSDFDPDPFVTIVPDRSELVEFISREVEKGSARTILKLPQRPAFSETKIRRIVSSHSNTQQAQRWWSAQDSMNEALEVLHESRALLLVGPPGTGKTRLAFELAKSIIGEDEKRLHLFQFHASYAYEDFIEALKPVPIGSGLSFEPVLKRFALACQVGRTQKQVVILDELNRADVSKVFGEAFLLIEREYRDEKYAIPHLYDPSREFWIPPDLYVIATLNDLDKSTYDLDFAFRRRFGQVDLTPNANLLEEILTIAGCQDEDFIRILRSAFNEVQTYYPLGHAYFKSVKDRESLRSTYRRVIRPTIAAYLGLYRKDDLVRVDSIFKRVIEVPTWEEYINVEG
ncbi:MAG: AAA family ATPase [Chloroflexi bacterium]|nr:AAA family ATPase [Chloroflexota bacterium]